MANPVLTAKLIESIRYAAGHGQAVLLSPEDGLALTDEIARLRAERDEARLQGAREERAAVVAYLDKWTAHPVDDVMDAMTDASIAIEAGEHRKRPRPTEPPVVVVRREVGDE